MVKSKKTKTSTSTGLRNSTPPTCDTQSSGAAQDTDPLFTTLAEQSIDCVLRLSCDGTILFGNTIAAEWFGVPPDKIAGPTIHDHFKDLVADGFWHDLLSGTCAKPGPQRTRLSISKNNRPYVLDICTTAEAPLPSGTRSVIATIRDSTALHSQTLELEKHQQRLTYHLHNSPLAVIEWDISGACTLWNDEAERLFGWSHQEANQLFDNCLNLVHQEDRKRFLETYRRLLTGRETSALIQCRVHSPSNAVSICDWYLSSLLNDSAESTGILCLINDVTERELFESKLQSLTTTLEEKIKVQADLNMAANQTLQREQLIRRQLERDMIGISEREHRRIGHDLHDGICQELAGIRFAISAMAATAETNSPLRARLLQIEEAILRAMEETRLLARGLAPMELDHGDLFSSLHEFASNTSRLHHVTCRIRWRGMKGRFSPEIATHLFRIAQEAIHNAIHHGSATTLLISISINQRSARLMVDDNGNGLPPHESKPTEGRGMGRKIMAHRASVLNGTVSLSPRRDAPGARLTCTFPLESPKNPCQPKPKPSSKSKSSKTTH